MSLIDITPQMTSNISEPYKIVANSEYSSSYEAWKMFDKNTNSYWCTAAGIENGIFTLTRTDGKLIKVSNLVIDTGTGSYPFNGVKVEISTNDKDFTEVFNETITAYRKEIDLKKLYQVKSIRITCLMKVGSYPGIYEMSLLYNDLYPEEDLTQNAFTINKILKENLPVSIDPSKDELYFTEDGGIHISKQDGTIMQCNAGNIVKEISNPLTTTPLEYGCFKPQTDTFITQNSNITIDMLLDGNMKTSGDKVLLTNGKTYAFNLTSVFVGTSAGTVTLEIINATGERLGASVTAAPTSNINNCFSPSVNFIYTAKENDYLQIKVLGCTLAEAKIRDMYTRMTLQEIRNNPVNQYGGFETQVLFDGNIETVGEYNLADNVNNYDFIIADISHSGGVKSLIPNMTSNTTPSPYVISASSEVRAAYGAFNGVVGKENDTWYSSTTKEWLKVDMGVSQKVTGFSIINGQNSSGYANYPPKSFTFECSNDGNTFDVIKTVIDMKRLGDSEEMEFKLNTPINTRYIKFNFTEGYNSQIIIGEIKIIGERIDQISRIILSDQITKHDKIILFTKNNTVQVLELNGCRLSKITGIKGQLPSLLSGGEF